MSKPGQLTHGMPPRPNDVQRAIRDLQRDLNEMHGMLVAATNTANGAATTANSALSQMAGYNWSAGDFAVSTSGSAVINKTLTVPSGFTKLSFFAGAAADANNSYTGYDSFYAIIKVGGLSSNSVWGSAASTITANTAANLAGVLTGLTAGNTVSVQLQLTSFNASWSAAPGNAADLSLLAIWQA